MLCVCMEMVCVYVCMILWICSIHPCILRKSIESPASQAPSSSWHVESQKAFSRSQAWSMRHLITYYILPFIHLLSIFVFVFCFYDHIWYMQLGGAKIHLLNHLFRYVCNVITLWWKWTFDVRIIKYALVHISINYRQKPIDKIFLFS